MPNYKLHIIETALVPHNKHMKIKRSEEYLITVNNECLPSNFQCFYNLHTDFHIANF